MNNQPSKRKLNWIEPLVWGTIFLAIVVGVIVWKGMM